MKNETGVVLIHGAGLGGYIWDDVKSRINTPTLAIDLPNRNSTGKTNSKLSLNDYQDYVIQQIEQWKYEKLILVTHSIGGVVGLKVANHFGDRVVGFIAISSAIPDNGDSYSSCLPFPQAVLMKLFLKLLGTKPPANVIKTTLCNDLTEQQSEKIVKNFTAESTHLYFDRCESVLRVAKKFYIKLEKDKAFSPEMQDNSIKNLKALQVVNLSTGHLPMISQPKEFSEVLNRLINSCLV